jgi:hypothetical protein
VCTCFFPGWWQDFWLVQPVKSLFVCLGFVILLGQHVNIKEATGISAYGKMFTIQNEIRNFPITQTNIALLFINGKDYKIFLFAGSREQCAVIAGPQKWHNLNL